MPIIFRRSSPSRRLFSPLPPEATSSSLPPPPPVDPNLLFASPPSPWFSNLNDLIHASLPVSLLSTRYASIYGTPPPPLVSVSPPSPPLPPSRLLESLPLISPAPLSPEPTSSEPPSSPTLLQPSIGKSTGLSPGLLAAGIVAVIGVVCIILLLFVWYKKKKRGENAAGTGSSNIRTSAPEAPNRDNRQNSQPQQWELKASPQGCEVPMLPKSSPPLAAESPQQLLSASYNSELPPPVSSSTGGWGPVHSVLENQLKQSFSTKAFEIEELAEATNGFSEDIGAGGFGYVYKGILSDGNEVAVKCLKEKSRQGDREFLTEIEIISRVHHKHLVSLLGYCVNGNQRMLVYEFVPNKTLDFHLHAKDRPTLDWASRLKIAIGTAKGLAYLHEDCHPKIVHRDIKATNILLDSKFEAKVADFGLAKFFTGTDTHVSTRIMGTFGYLAPEYASTGKLTVKSDVYSFGVTLLELITGCSPFHESRFDLNVSFVDSVRPLLTQAIENGNYDAFVDPRLQDYNATEMERMVACANACVRVFCIASTLHEHDCSCLGGTQSYCRTERSSSNLKQQIMKYTTKPLHFHSLNEI